MDKVKSIRAKSKAGAGLFTDSPLPVCVEFDNGDKVELNLMPLTQDMIVDLHRDGIKFQDYTDPSEAFDHSGRIFDKIVIDAKYLPSGGDAQELEGKYRRRLMQLPDVMAGIFEAASEHGATIYKEDEKNSES